MSSFCNNNDPYAQLRMELSPDEFANFLRTVEAPTILSAETLKDRRILSSSEFCSNSRNRREVVRIISTLGFEFNILNVVGDGKCLIHAFMSGSESQRTPFDIFRDGILAIFQSDESLYTQYFTIEDTTSTPTFDGEYPLLEIQVHRHEVRNTEKMFEHFTRLTSGNNIDSRFAHVLAYGEHVDVVFISIDNLRATPSSEPLQVHIHEVPRKRHFVDGHGWLVDHPRQVFILSWGGHNYCLLPESPINARERCEAYVRAGVEERMQRQIAEQAAIEREIAERATIEREIAEQAAIERQIAELQIADQIHIDRGIALQFNIDDDLRHQQEIARQNEIDRLIQSDCYGRW